MSTAHGKLIVFEGGDRSGKSTQCQLLVDALLRANYSCSLYKFPNRDTEIGLLIDLCLKKELVLPPEALCLLFAANRYECRAAIEADLCAGKHVVVDRYTYSGIAFATTQGLGYTWAESLESYLPEPDLVLFLKVPLEARESRADYGHELYEKNSVQQRAQKIYDILARRKSWKIIDGTQSIEDVHTKVLAHVFSVEK